MEFDLSLALGASIATAATGLVVLFFLEPRLNARKSLASVRSKMGSAQATAAVAGG